MTLWRYRSSWFGRAAAGSLCWLLLLAWGPVQAQEKVCDPKDPEKCAVGVQEGQAAPFSGQLLTPKLAVDLGQKAETFDLRLELEVEFRAKDLKIDLDAQKQLRELEKQSFDLERKLLLTRLDEAQSTPWYEHPAFVVVVTAAVTLLLVVGTGYALKSLD